MTEEIQEQITSEIDSLKAKADIMGITYHPNIGVDKLKAKIQAKTDPEPEPESNIEDLAYAEEIETIEEAEAAAGLTTYTKNAKLTAMEMKNKRKQNALRLVRVRVTNMNPVKGALKGEILSAGNASIGFVKKYIPYNAEQGWHVPNILLQVMKDKKFMSHYEVKVGNKKVKRNRLVPEYAIEIMEPLTGKEINDLRQRQIIAAQG